ncbi:AAA family ATPase [Halomonas sp. V046]|uniref:AAA family ATPase n=1 Tax=Halomonas sp. V046 TaxID=3459611 RepID=UPI004043F985
MRKHWYCVTHTLTGRYIQDGGQLRSPVLYIFSGLPASGKSTLAKQLAAETRSSYLRIDTVEQGLRDLCKFKV